MNEPTKKNMKTEHEITEAACIADFMEVKETEGWYDNYGKLEPIWHTTNGIFRSLTYSVPKKSYAEFLEKSKYNSSWEWLMPVVEKICRLRIGDGKEFVDYANLRTFGMLNEETGEIMVRLNSFPLFQADTLLAATYGAAVDFVRWWMKNRY